MLACQPGNIEGFFPVNPRDQSPVTWTGDCHGCGGWLALTPLARNIRISASQSPG
jgi:LSD1 subclass zinc finger protein